MIKKIKNLLSRKNSPYLYSGSAYLYGSGMPVWSRREYSKFASEAYTKNVIAHRAISMIATAASSVPLKLYARRKTTGQKWPMKKHQLLDLLASPNPTASGKDFLESLYTYKQISGNAYVLAVGPEKGAPKELYSLRPDRVTVIAGDNFVPKGYRYQVEQSHTDYMTSPITGKSQVLHIKNFHPLSDWYGLSSIEAAAYSIDQHNQAGEWNQSLLQNGARPSGALIMQKSKEESSLFTDEQYNYLKNMIEDNFAGAQNSGKPLLLQGGLDWKEMSLSPRDMDFIESKNSSARDIALALGVPPQLLGIPGDNTYSNLQEARIAMWEQTIIPMVDSVVGKLNSWLTPLFDEELELSYDTDAIPALASKREAVWDRIKDANFMTTNEKRETVGLEPRSDRDSLDNS